MLVWREMKKPEKDITKYTINFWRKRTGKTFSQEDARQMVTNISGFFTVLSEWSRKDCLEQQSVALPAEQRGDKG